MVVTRIHIYIYIHLQNAALFIYRNGIGDVILPEYINRLQRVNYRICMTQSEHSRQLGGMI